MKNKHLIKALEFAKSRGIKVTRQHTSDGLTMVRLEDSEGKMSAGRVYKTGSSNPQARYIMDAAKRFKLVERGVIIHSQDGRTYFFSEKYKTLYAWHEESKVWRLWIAVCDHEPDYISWCLDGKAMYKASVNVEKLTSTLYYS